MYAERVTATCLRSAGAPSFLRSVLTWLTKASLVTTALATLDEPSQTSAVLSGIHQLHDLGRGLAHLGVLAGDLCLLFRGELLLLCRCGAAAGRAAWRGLLGDRQTVVKASIEVNSIKREIFMGSPKIRGYESDRQSKAGPAPTA